MTESNRYLTLKEISVLMALDTAGLIAENVISFWSAILARNPQYGTLLNEISIYSAWTMWALRLLIWSLTLVSLSRLTSLYKSFGNARIWYLLRLSFLILQPLSITFASHRLFLSSSESQLVAERLMITLALAFLGELSLSIGNRVILFAGAELLDSFGLDSPAKKNRRCGNRLIGYTAAQTLFFAVAFALVVWIRFFQGRRLFGAGESGAAMSETIAIFSAVLFGLFARLGVIVFRVLASVHMSRTYRTIKGLME